MAQQDFQARRAERSRRMILVGFLWVVLASIMAAHSLSYGGSILSMLIGAFLYFTISLFVSAIYNEALRRKYG